MRDRKLERLFDRFRQRGDVGALGEVFDATAPELLRVAMSLVRDPGEADDVLQATYLTAIERAERYDAGRRLVPWLLGILVRHVHDLRRTRARRRAEGLPEDLSVEQDPGAKAEAEEFHQLLEEALGSVSPASRAVLEPFLREGKRAADIARDTGQAPGTVRMQIHRGLDQLRRALPAGAASAAALTALGGRGFAAVRAEVMRRGAEASAGLAAATTGSVAITSGTALFGGLTVKQLAVAALVVALVGTVGWMAATDPAVPPVPPADRGTVAAADLAGEDSPESLLLRGETTVATEDSARVEATTTRTSPEASAYEAALGSYGGRLLADGGEPLAGIELVLFQVNPTIFSRSLQSVLGQELRESDVVVDRTRTDDEGRFTLRGSQGLGFRLLGIDLGGQRSAVRLLDVPNRRGATAEIGDVVLEPTTRLRGIVVDGAGQPVAGARVRAGHVPADLAGVGLEVLRKDSAVLIPGHDMGVFEMPGWMRTYTDKLPVPTTHTDAQGRFTLNFVPAGDVSVFVDHPGKVAVNEWLGVLQADGDRDLGEFTLEEAGRITGRVLDHEGEPVAGAEVLVGSFPSPGLIAQPAGRTDADGRFEVAALDPGCVPFAAARRQRAEAWSLVFPQEEPDAAALASGEVVVTLPPRGVIVVQSTRNGELLDPTSVRIVSEPVDMMTPFVSGLRPLEIAPVRTGEGRWELRDLPFGAYNLLAHAGDHVVAETRVELDDGRVEIEMYFESDFPFRILVVDDATGEPVSRASVSLQRSGVVGPSAANGVTGADGLVTLTPSNPDMMEIDIRVSHPAYAVAWSIDAVPGDSAEDVQEVRLSPGGTLEARVTHGGVSPPMDLMLVIEHDGAEGFDDLPSFVPVIDGVARIEGLAAGIVRFSVVERLFDRTNPIALMAENAFPENLLQDEVMVEASGVTEVEIDLAGPSRDDLHGTCTLEGVVSIDGQPVEGLTVRVWIQESGALTPKPVDASGRFRVDGFPAGTVRVEVQRQLRWEDQAFEVSIFQETFEMQPGEIRFLDYAWDPVRVAVTLLDPAGRPVPQQMVGGNDMAGTFVGGETDHRGVASLDLLTTGTFHLNAMSFEHGYASHVLEVPEGTTQDLAVTLQFEAGVACEGIAEITRELSGNHRWMLSIWPEGGEGGAAAWLEFEGAQAPFSATGLRPGDHRAMLWMDDSPSTEVTFTLPEGGARDLHLVFAKPERESGPFIYSIPEEDR